MKHRSPKQRKPRIEARRERYDRIKDDKTRRGMRRPGSQNPHKGA